MFLFDRFENKKCDKNSGIPAPGRDSAIFPAVCTIADSRGERGCVGDTTEGRDPEFKASFFVR